MGSMYALRTPTHNCKASGQEKVGDAGGVSVDKEKVLKVSWDREMGNYSSVKLREIFERFGGVEDVVIRSKKSKKIASAIVVAATKTMSGSISNPLLVLPLPPGANNIPSTSPAYNADTINPKSSNVAGTGFQDYEASILKKLEKVAATKTMSGSISNPLLVLPLQPGANNIPSTSPAYNTDTINPKSSNAAGTGFQDYEASILKKLEK